MNWFTVLGSLFLSVGLLFVPLRLGAGIDQFFFYVLSLLFFYKGLVYKKDVLFYYTISLVIYILLLGVFQPNYTVLEFVKIITYPLVFFAGCGFLKDTKIDNIKAIVKWLSVIMLALIALSILAMILNNLGVKIVKESKLWRRGLHNSKFYFS